MIKYFDKVVLFFLFTFVPFIVFMILMFYYRTKTEDLHLVLILTANSVLYINMNVLGVIFIKKNNKILKLLKSKIDE
jgi:hypothetical protein